MYRDDSISIAHAVRAIITDLRTRCGVWIDVARVAPEVAADAAALDGAYLALARAGEALDEAIEALERARGNPQPAPAAPAPAPSGVRSSAVPQRDWQDIAHRNVATTIDLARVDAVHCTALYDDLHAQFILPGGRVYVRLSGDAAMTLLDDLYRARLLQAHQRDALRAALAEPHAPAPDAAEEAVQ